MTKELRDAEFEAATAEGIVLVDFWAPWCGPCRMQGPVVDQLSEELDGQVECYKMNVDEEQQVAGSFGIMSIPTMIIKQEGQVVEKLIGYHDKARLTSILNKYLKN